jgi:hypothetical protein
MLVAIVVTDVTCSLAPSARWSKSLPGSNWTWLPTTAGAALAGGRRGGGDGEDRAIVDVGVVGEHVDRTTVVLAGGPESGLATGASLRPAMWKTSAPVSLPSLSETV